mmetsp:Transcript_4121/g.8302  ORF Transcript_4121/g.8302 Transcript_4121/m.8302 type:complete len:108 (+) Transcript_4121:160-483(+)|eukprot:CAMPEP_0116973904 /NCGR_PEP_ID=MMETSP0467-20121206/54812_1 /TAXON_ID=283647 /ORGANISM="Mesodinium pulex, Strain SPMC105" /LENGTH=107 /DNA_ID=CAMNT_0004665869 /DNA_START=160 /DNA_END=483 /DNA_ORIENTATION=+
MDSIDNDKTLFNEMKALRTINEFEDEKMGLVDNLNKGISDLQIELSRLKSENQTYKSSMDKLDQGIKNSKHDYEESQAQYNQLKKLNNELNELNETQKKKLDKYESE